MEEIIVCYYCGKIMHVENTSSQNEDIHVVWDICHECLDEL